jgi:hypothetical protein
MKETCEYCSQEFLVDSEANEPKHEGHKASWRDPYACPQECIRVLFGEDPYDSEINHDNTLRWLCDRCRYDRAMDI